VFEAPAYANPGVLVRQPVQLAPTRLRRLLVALAAGLTAGLAAFLYHSRPEAAPDFIYPWAAARYLASGINPYSALPGGLTAPFQAPLLYPLPAILVATPLSWFPLPVAVGTFVAMSVFLLSYTLTSRNWEPLICLASAPLILAVLLGQWSPLLTAAALLPAGGVLATTKPNLGLALTVYRPTRIGILGSALFLALSIWVLPTWPRDWLHSLSLDQQSGTHVAPIMTPLGFALALALLRWRRPEARLFIAMACVPQLLFFYDQLPLLLVPSTKGESYAVIIPSSVAFLVWLLVGHGHESGPRVAEWCVMLSIYVPCLIIILRRPNEGLAIAGPARFSALKSRLLHRRGTGVV
jgi:hypothetical protein